MHTPHNAYATQTVRQTIKNRLQTCNLWQTQDKQSASNVICRQLLPSIVLPMQTLFGKTFYQRQQKKQTACQRQKMSRKKNAAVVRNFTLVLRWKRCGDMSPQRFVPFPMSKYSGEKCGAPAAYQPSGGVWLCLAAHPIFFAILTSTWLQGLGQAADLMQVLLWSLTCHGWPSKCGGSGHVQFSNHFAFQYCIRCGSTKNYSTWVELAWCLATSSLEKNRTQKLAEPDLN